MTSAGHDRITTPVFDNNDKVVVNTQSALQTEVQLCLSSTSFTILSIPDFLCANLRDDSGADLGLQYPWSWDFIQCHSIRESETRKSLRT